MFLFNIYPDWFFKCEFMYLNSNSQLQFKYRVSQKWTVFLLLRLYIQIHLVRIEYISGIKTTYFYV